jgi:hypothetical protein
VIGPESTVSTPASEPLWTEGLFYASSRSRQQHIDEFRFGQATELLNRLRLPHSIFYVRWGREWIDQPLDRDTITGNEPTQ